MTPKYTRKTFLHLIVPNVCTLSLAAAVRKWAEASNCNSWDKLPKCGEFSRAAAATQPSLVPVEPPSHHEELFRRGARHPAQLHAAQHRAAQHRAAWFMQWKQMLQISKASSRSTPHVLHIERCSHNTLCVMCRKLFHFKIFTNANVRQLKAEARQVRVWFGERSQDW